MVLFGNHTLTYLSSNFLNVNRGAELYFVFFFVDEMSPCLSTAATSGPIVVPKMLYMSMEPRWNDIDKGKLKNSEKNLFQCHFVHHKSQMDSSGHYPGERRAINHLSHGTTYTL
jgi:hypothetical protein